MTTDYVEVHIMRPLPLSLWPDDDGPYWDEPAYRQIILDNPSAEQLAAIDATVERYRTAGYTIERY